MPFLGLELFAAKRPRVESPRQTQAIPRPAVSQTVDAEQEVHASLEPTPEQIRYAGVLEKGTRLGLLCLFITFPLYILGILEPHTPVENVCECWGFQAHEYQAQTGIESGWGWVRMLGCGDYLNFVGIVALAGVSAVCYLAVLPLMFQRRDTIYAVLALLQVVVLILAATGVLAAGH